MSNEKTATAPKALGFFTYVETPDSYLAGSAQNFRVSRLPLIEEQDPRETIKAFHRGEIQALSTDGKTSPRAK